MAGSAHMPTVFGAGYFDSHDKFGDMRVTPERPVVRYELEFFPQPGGTLFADGRQYDIFAGMIFVARPGQLRHSYLPFCSYYVKLEDADGALADTLATLPECAQTAHIETYIALVRRLSLDYESTVPAARLGATAALFELVSRLGTEFPVSAAPGEMTGARQRAAVSAAVTYISTHFREPCRLSEIAAAAGFSPVYFNRLFLHLTGQTPRLCLLHRRLDEARRLILTRECPLAEVAERCGFSSSSYFTLVFGRTYGMTPGAFRERERNKYLDL